MPETGHYVPSTKERNDREILLREKSSEVLLLWRVLRTNKRVQLPWLPEVPEERRVKEWARKTARFNKSVWQIRDEVLDQGPGPIDKTGLVIQGSEWNYPGEEVVLDRPFQEATAGTGAVIKHNRHINRRRDKLLGNTQPNHQRRPDLSQDQTWRCY